MSEFYDIDEVNEVTMDGDLEELLSYFKEKILETDAEDGKNSKLSQYVDGFDKIYKLIQADRNSEFDQEIKSAEKERKNCEYLEDVARRTEENKIRNRELELKERETYFKELTAKASTRWWNNPVVPTLMSCLTVFGVNRMAIRINNSEFPIKNGTSNWMIKPNIKLPFGQH